MALLRVYLICKSTIFFIPWYFNVHDLHQVDIGVPPDGLSPTTTVSEQGIVTVTESHSRCGTVWVGHHWWCHCLCRDSGCPVEKVLVPDSQEGGEGLDLRRDRRPALTRLRSLCQTFTSLGVVEVARFWLLFVLRLSWLPITTREGGRGSPKRLRITVS